MQFMVGLQDLKLSRNKDIERLHSRISVIYVVCLNNAVRLLVLIKSIEKNTVRQVTKKHLCEQPSLTDFMGNLMVI